MSATSSRARSYKVLFVCTGNSARSQMAEGFARKLGYDASSAGTEPAARVNPNAVTVMREKGIDISEQRPERYDPDRAAEMDMVVTVCGDAEEKCPALPPGVRRVHWPLVDPASAVGEEAELLNVFRRIRDEIRDRMGDLPMKES